MKPDEQFSYFFDVGVDVLSTTLDPSTGTILAQLGDVTKGSADSDSAEKWYGAPGLVARPALPTQGKASCQVVTLKRSNHDIAFAYRDLRANNIFGNLAPGEGCFYATSGMARVLAKANGSLWLYTTDSNTDAGNAIFAGVSSYYQGTDGQPHLGGEVRYSAPWGGAWHDPSGFHLRTHHGVKFDLGGLTLPAPISATAATATLAADVISLKAQSVKLGLGVAPQPVVLAQSLQTSLVSFATALSLFAKAVDTFATSVAAVPTVGEAASVMAGAAEAFASTTATLMAAIAIATGATSAAAS